MSSQAASSGVDGFPKTCPLTLHFLNIILFCMSVPVLSLNTKSICPNSSIKSDALHMPNFSDSLQYIYTSFPMRYAWVSFSNSIITYREMGIK